MISCLELDDARLDDGSVIMVGKETLEAKRGQTLFPSVKASQRRVVKNRIHEIEQDGYCHSGRKLPNARFIELSSITNYHRELALPWRSS
jgi:hypothetical protein